MSRITPDGFLQVTFVPDTPGIATPASPSLAGEINHANSTDLTDYITPTGLDLPDEGTDADSSDLGSARDKSVPATVGGQYTCEFYRDDGTGGGADDAWDALPRLTDGFLVVARFGGSGADNAINTGDSVEVYDVRVSQRSNNRLVRGETMRFTVTFAPQADMVDGTVVA